MATAFTLAAVVSLAATHPLVSATSGGDPYSLPLVNDTNPDPRIVETTLTAEPATVEIGNGVTAHAQTFNGQIPGPTFQLEVGDTVIVHFRNHLSRETSIHWHGIELANAVDGSPFTQNQVQPGGNFLYKFTVSRPGIFWYHPHHHASTNQVFKGLSGMIVVKDPNEGVLQAYGALPPATETKPIVLSDTTVCKEPGSNDELTYDPSLPHVSGAPLPEQAPPTPKNLCEGPGTPGPPTGGNPYPIDEDGVQRGPFAAGDIPNIQTANHVGISNEGQTVLTNGKNAGGRAGGPCTPGGGCPTVTPPGALEAGASLLDVQPGQGLRLQLLNASNTRYFRLQLTTPGGALVPLIRVGGEAGLLDNAVEEGGTKGTWDTKYQAGEILVPPGGRADVVAAIPPAPTSGVLTLWTEDYERNALGFANLPTVPVMHLNLTGSAVSPPYTIAAGDPLLAATANQVETLGAPTGSLLDPAAFAPAKAGLSAQKVKLTVDFQTALGVDGTFGAHDLPGDYGDAPHLDSSRYARLGDTLQLEVENVAGANHPFHLHGFSIQPLSLTNGGETFTWPYPEFRDVVDVPGGFTLTFRVRLDPRPLADGTTPGGGLGRWIFHCHMFFHTDHGLLSELVVTAPDGNERPNVNVDDAELEVTAGEIATVTGTYRDPDGDPVTLSPSVGSIADNGGGRYTWTYPTGGAAGSRIVYVTATDSNGLSNQIPLQLRVSPAPSEALAATPVARRALPLIKRLRVVPRRFAPTPATMRLKRHGVRRRRSAHRRRGATKARAARKRRGRRGATIKFWLSKRAKVQFNLRRLAPRRPRVRGPRFSRRFKKGGKKSIRFTGRFSHRRPLPPGTYRLTARARDTAGRSSKRVATKFRVVR